MALPSDIEYGVTSTGFVRKRLPEIQEDIFRNFEARLGQNVTRTPNSMIAVLVGVFADEIDRQWQLAEKDYYDRSPMSAGEGSIDNTLTYTMVTRKTAESSYLYAVCYGIPNTVLPSNCRIQDTEGRRWNINRQAKITLDNCVNIKMTISSVRAGTIYGIKIYEIAFNYVAQDGDIPTLVYNELATKINASSKNRWNAIPSAEGIEIILTDRQYGTIVVPYDSMEVVEIGSPIKFVCEQTGEIDPPLYTVTSINVTVYGWRAVSNESKAYVGRDAESLEDIRMRYATAVYSKSVGMVESIKAAVEALEDVRTVMVRENRSDVEQDGLKPHSFKVIVRGGDKESIAKAIMSVAPVGIDTNGEESVLVEQDNIIETIYFSRPKDVPIYVEVVLHYYDEEKIMGDTVEVVKRAIADYGNSLEYGKDVMPQRFFGSVFSAVSGVSHMEIKMRRDSNWVEDRIPIDYEESAIFSEENIEVIIVEQ